MILALSRTTSYTLYSVAFANHESDRCISNACGGIVVSGSVCEFSFIGNFFLNHIFAFLQEYQRVSTFVIFRAIAKGNATCNARFLIEEYEKWNVHKNHTPYPVISRFLTQAYSCQETNEKKASDPTH
jgi:hypothetical protein